MYLSNLNSTLNIPFAKLIKRSTIAQNIKVVVKLMSNGSRQSNLKQTNNQHRFWNVHKIDISIFNISRESNKFLLRYIGLLRQKYCKFVMLDYTERNVVGTV